MRNERYPMHYDVCMLCLMTKPVTWYIFNGPGGDVPWFGYEHHGAVQDFSHQESVEHWDDFHNWSLIFVGSVKKVFLYWILFVFLLDNIEYFRQRSSVLRGSTDRLPGMLFLRSKTVTLLTGCQEWPSGAKPSRHWQAARKDPLVQNRHVTDAGRQMTF